MKQPCWEFPESTIGMDKPMAKLVRTVAVLDAEKLSLLGINEGWDFH